MFVISRSKLKGLGRHLSMRILGAKVKFSVGHGKFNFPPLYASSGRIPLTQVTSVTQFNAIFVTQKCRVLRCNSLSMVAFSDNYYSLVFKTRRTNLNGSDWQTEKQGHWNRNSGYVFNLSQEAFESEEVNRTNKRQRR